MELGNVDGAIDLVRNGGGLIKEIVNGAKAIRDAMRGTPDGLPDSRIVDMVSSLVEKLVEVQLAQSEILDRLHMAEAALRTAQTRHDEAQRYQLTRLSMGGLVLALKDGDPKGEPFHYLCQGCADQGKKRILQPFGQSTTTLECPTCKTMFRGG